MPERASPHIANELLSEHRQEILEIISLGLKLDSDKALNYVSIHHTTPEEDIQADPHKMHKVEFLDSELALWESLNPGEKIEEIRRFDIEGWHLEAPEQPIMLMTYYCDTSTTEGSRYFYGIRITELGTIDAMSHNKPVSYPLAKHVTLSAFSKELGTQTVFEPFRAERKYHVGYMPEEDTLLSDEVRQLIASHGYSPESVDRICGDIEEIAEAIRQLAAQESVEGVAANHPVGDESLKEVLKRRIELAVLSQPLPANINRAFIVDKIMGPIERYVTEQRSQELVQKAGLGLLHPDELTEIKRLLEPYIFKG